MGAELQTLVVAVVVAVAALSVARRLLRTLATARRHDDGCAGGCGCAAPPRRGR
jgi:hypothetical protein